jgi:hypothetical protein
LERHALPEAQVERRGDPVGLAASDEDQLVGDVAGREALHLELVGDALHRGPRLIDDPQRVVEVGFGGSRQRCRGKPAIATSQEDQR